MSSRLLRANRVGPRGPLERPLSKDFYPRQEEREAVADIGAILSDGTAAGLILEKGNGRLSGAGVRS